MSTTSAIPQDNPVELKDDMRQQTDYGPKMFELLQSWRKVLLPSLLLVVILAIWEYVADKELMSRLVLAGPSQIVAALIDQWPVILDNAGVTVAQALIGFVAGNALGLLVAIVFVHSAIIRRTLYPLSIGAEAIPFIAIIPVLILWLGNGMAPKIFIITINTFFPMLINAVRGLKSADNDVSEMLYTFGASTRQRLFMVRLPASVPFLFNALKLSACGSIVTSLVAEWLASERGLGYLIVDYGQDYKIPELWATALLASAISMAVYGLVVWAEYLCTPWKRNRHSSF
jgi:ABC-type nitrate/sulfonate/bicarbonate transport system permease component